MPHKRIAFAVETTLGNATFLKNLQRGLSHRSDVAPVWLPIDENADDIWERFPGVRSKLSFKGGLRTRDALRRAASKRAVDAALIHTQRMAHLAVDFMARTPTVISMDGTPFGLEAYVRLYNLPLQHEGWVGRIKHAINRSTYLRARRIISLSAYTKNSLVNDYRVPEEHVVVIPPGVDTQLWRPAPEKRPPGGPVRILFVGADWRRKGGELLMRWAQETSRTGWELHLVTNAQVEVPPNVFVHRGLGPNAPELIELAQRAHLFVLPTLADMHSIATLEAKATGLPAVVTRVAGVAETVQDGVDGFLVPPGDFAALAERLDYLVERPELLREMGQRARQLAEERFDATDCVSRIMATIEAIL